MKHYVIMAFTFNAQSEIDRIPFTTSVRVRSLIRHIRIQNVKLNSPVPSKSSVFTTRILFFGVGDNNITIFGNIKQRILCYMSIADAQRCCF